MLNSQYISEYLQESRRGAKPHGLHVPRYAVIN